MRRPGTIFATYAVAWLYLAGFVVAQVIYAVLSSRDQAAVTAWASTNVHNLTHDPVGSLIASAFVTGRSVTAWPVLIALALAGATRVLGNWRTALVCAAGHVIGTLVSEGIVGYRVARGLLPASDRYLIDVGPSYVVVSAIVVVLLYGSACPRPQGDDPPSRLACGASSARGGWPARGAAALGLALLIGAGNIFGGLSQLGVSAVGHLTAMVVAAAGGSLLVWLRARSASLGKDPAGAGQPG